MQRAGNYQWVEVGAMYIRTENKDGFHVVYLEYGSPTLAADPWLRPTMERKAEINKIIMGVFRKWVCPMSKPPDMPMYAYLDSLIRPIAGECAAITYLADGALPDAFAVYTLVAATPQAHFSGGRGGKTNATQSPATPATKKRRWKQQPKPSKPRCLQAVFCL